MIQFFHPRGMNYTANFTYMVMMVIFLHYSGILFNDALLGVKVTYWYRNNEYE